jgi:hypothetical protein
MTLSSLRLHESSETAHATGLLTSVVHGHDMAPADTTGRESEKYSVPHHDTRVGDTRAKNGAVPPGSSIDTLVSLDRWLPHAWDRAQWRQRWSTRERFDVLAQWEGVVLSVGVDYFVARLIDLTEAHPDEEAEFDMLDVSDADRALLSSGASFYWVLGYHTKANGQRVRESVLRFRRLPAWTAQDIDEAQTWAADIADRLSAE